MPSPTPPEPPVSQTLAPAYEGDWSDGPHTSDEYLSHSPALGGHVYPPTDNTQSGDSDSFLRGPTDRHNTLANPINSSRHHHKHERRHALAQCSPQELVKLVLREEHRSTETRRLLHSAIEKLQVNAARLAQAEQAREAAEKARRALEAEQLKRTTTFTKNLLDVQREVEKARREASDFQFKMNIAEDRLKRAELQTAQMQRQRDDAIRASQKAQKRIQQIEEERDVLVASEQGRREGYEEGVRRGRELALEDTNGVPLLGYGPVPKRIKGPDDRRASVKVPTPAPPQPEPLPVPPPQDPVPIQVEPPQPHSRSASVRTNRTTRTTRTTASSVMAAQAEAKMEEAEMRLQQLNQREGLLMSKQQEMDDREREVDARLMASQAREHEMARIMQEDRDRIAAREQEIERVRQMMEQRDREREERRKEQERRREEEERVKKAQQERDAAAALERERQEQKQKEKEAQKQERQRRKQEEREMKRLQDELLRKLEQEERERRLEQERERDQLQAHQRELELQLQHKAELDQVRREGLEKELKTKMDRIQELEEDMEERLRNINARVAAAAFIPSVATSSGPATPYHPYSSATPQAAITMPLPVPAPSVSFPVPTVPSMAEASSYIAMPVPPPHTPSATMLGPITGMPQPNVPITGMPQPNVPITGMPQPTVPVIPTPLSTNLNMPQPVVPNILSPPAGSGMPQPAIPVISASNMHQQVIPPPGSVSMSMPDPNNGFPAPRVPTFPPTPGGGPGVVPGSVTMPMPGVPQQFQPPPPGYSSRPTSRSTSRTGTDPGGRKGHRRKTSSPDGSNTSSVGLGDLRLTSFPIPGHEVTATGTYQPWDRNHTGGGYPAAPTTVMHANTHQPGFVVEPSKKGKRRDRDRGVKIDNQGYNPGQQRVGSSSARSGTPGGASLPGIPEQSFDEDEDSDEESSESSENSGSTNSRTTGRGNGGRSGHGHGSGPSTVEGLYGPPQSHSQPHSQPYSQPRSQTHSQPHSQSQAQQKMPRPKSVGWSKGESPGMAGVGAGFQPSRSSSSSQPSPVIRPQQPDHLGIYGYNDPRTPSYRPGDSRSPRSTSTTSLQLDIVPPSRPQSRYEDHNNPMNPISPGGFLLPSGEASPRLQHMQLAPDNQEPPVIPVIPEAQFGPPPPNFVAQSFTPSGTNMQLPATGAAISVAGVGGNPWSASPSGGRAQPLGGSSPRAVPTSVSTWGSNTSTKRGSLYGNTNTSSQPRTVGTVPNSSSNQPLEPFIPPPDDSFESTTKKKGSKKAATAAASAAPRGGGSFFGGLWGGGGSAPAPTDTGDTDSVESDDQSSTTRKNTQLNSTVGRGGARVWESAGVEGMPGSISPSRGTIPMPVPSGMPVPVPPPHSQTMPIPVPSPQPLQVPPPNRHAAGAGAGAAAKAKKKTTGSRR